MCNSLSLQRLQSRLAVSRGEAPADTLIRNGLVLDVFSGEFVAQPLSVFDGVITGFEEVPARQILDLRGKFLVPGFIESHIHIESSKLTPVQFASAVLARGTTTVIADPHEIANVLGAAGIEFMLKDAADAPIDIFYMTPSCVPATDMETAGAVLSAEDLRPFLDNSKTLGIAEMMNFPGTFLGLTPVLEKLLLSQPAPLIDGHAPGLRGKNLSAYIAAGPATDHECSSIDEAREKLRKGMRIQIREGSTARNLDALLPLVTAANARRFMLVSDDLRPGDLQERGHLDHLLRQCVVKGLDPVTALRMVTVNPAEAYGLRDRGAIRPGAIADLVVLDDLKSFKINAVWKNGREIRVEEHSPRDASVSVHFPQASTLPVPLMQAADFRIQGRQSPVRVIGVIPHQIITEHLTMTLPERDGFLECDADRDVVKLTVIERYTGKGGRGIGFVQGLGIRQGAVASTVAHDSHNIIVAGGDDRSMAAAVNRLIEIGGGQVVVRGETVLAELALPIAGLMSANTITEVAAGEAKLIAASRELHSNLPDVFMALSFLALPVIPSLKLTDRGLVDVDTFKLVSLCL